MNDEDVSFGPVAEEGKQDTFEDTLNPLEMQDAEIPMEIEAPKVVSVEEKEILEAMQESVTKEKKDEVKEILVEARDTAKVVKEFLEE